MRGNPSLASEVDGEHEEHQFCNHHHPVNHIICICSLKVWSAQPSVGLNLP